MHCLQRLNFSLFDGNDDWLEFVPIHFFQLSDALIDACPHDWVLTPNERLAREFRRAYDQRQLSRGKAAWANPRVASIASYVRSAHERSAPLERRRVSLGSEAELLLWQELAAENCAPLCELAADAWRLLHGYRLGLDGEDFSRTLNARTFRNWTKRFRARLDEAGLIAGAQLADAIPGERERLHLVAFDEMPPQLADLLQRTECAGGEVLRHAPADLPARSQQRVEAASRAEEIHLAAQWARRALAQDGAARIGIVFPYLADAYFAIDHALGAEFADAPEALDISGGIPLAQQPVWQAALLLLRLATEGIGSGELETLKQSPYLNLAGKPRAAPPGTPEAGKGATSDKRLALPRDLPETARLTDLSKASGPLRKLAGRAAKLPRRQSFARWMEDFRALLGLASWGAAGAGSVQYQAHGQLAECLERYGILEQLPNLSAEEALQTLQRLLSNQLFAPQRQPAPVQVLGYLETTGLTFSHLWIAGMGDTAWPAAPSPNPLLPIALQRRHGVPRVDHRAEAAFARKRLQHWRRASGHLVFSHALEEGEERHECSALTASIPAIPKERLMPGLRVRRHPWLAEPPRAALQPVVEQHGSPIAAASLSGGTSLLRDQAQCPFRGWAVHRLNVRESQAPRTYPDALARGTLIHEALLALYEAGGDFEDVQRIEEVAAAAVDERLGGAPALYRHHERIRLGRLLTCWAAHERRRPAFQVIRLEQEAHLQLPGLELSVRIDRIDEDSATGHWIVIDYKTGQASAKRLLEDRLIEPQLPIYALTDARIRATLFAELAADRAKLSGALDPELDCAPARRLPLPEGGWDALAQRWREQLEALAAEHRAGYAAVAPASPNVCKTCHLPAFCRVGALAPSAE